jgi:hypothetical protein
MIYKGQYYREKVHIRKHENPTCGEVFVDREKECEL